MQIAIIKYNAGNIQSVLTALERLGITAEVTDDGEKIKAADKVIFPGVGEAGSAMKSLQQAGLDKVIKDLSQPVLGICVGMQLLCTHSEEGNTTCLGVVPVLVKKFSSLLPSMNNNVLELKTPTGAGHPSLRSAGEGSGVRLKVPQVGWNTISGLKTALFNGVPDDSYIYNVHSYYAADSDYTIARCHYGVTYAAAIKKDNFYGVQFHAEKSAATGDQIIQNFLAI